MSDHDKSRSGNDYKQRTDGYRSEGTEPIIIQRNEQIPYYSWGVDIKIMYLQSNYYVIFYFHDDALEVECLKKESCLIVNIQKN